jgi:DNA-binding transcriptional LysR family regulator
MLDLYKLKMFSLVADEGSFSAAAERLMMTQSGVSQHMRELEAGLGARLFVRGRRGVGLTPAGERLLDYTRRLLRLAAEAELAVTDVAHLREGRLAIGATPGVSAYQLPEWVQSFRGRYPNLAVAVRTDITPVVLDSLRRGTLDVGLIEGEIAASERAGLGIVVLDEVEQHVVVGPRHPWWGSDRREMSDLNGQAMIMRQPSSQTRIWLEEQLSAGGVRPRVVGEFDNVESIKRAVIAGNCLTVLPDYAVRDETALGLLRLVSLEGRPLRRELKLVWNGAAVISPITRAFLTHLEAVFPALAAALPPVS